MILVDLDDADKKNILSVPTNVTSEYVLGIVFWISDQSLGAIWLNRRQNYGVFVAYDSTTFVMREVRIFFVRAFIKLENI